MKWTPRGFFPRRKAAVEFDRCPYLRRKEEVLLTAFLECVGADVGPCANFTIFLSLSFLFHEMEGITPQEVALNSVRDRIERAWYPVSAT